MKRVRWWAGLFDLVDERQGVVGPGDLRLARTHRSAGCRRRPGTCRSAGRGCRSRTLRRGRRRTSPPRCASARSASRASRRAARLALELPGNSGVSISRARPRRRAATPRRRPRRAGCRAPRRRAVSAGNASSSLTAVAAAAGGEADRHHDHVRLGRDRLDERRVVHVPWRNSSRPGGRVGRQVPGDGDDPVAAPQRLVPDGGPRVPGPAEDRDRRHRALHAVPREDGSWGPIQHRGVAEQRQLITIAAAVVAVPPGGRKRMASSWGCAPRTRWRPARRGGSAGTGADPP